ncbi:hypothetical protein BU23DRAFT_35842 [Bimuria novae-zelandiae CBS 107.79]|uniref:Uncharacterized protein n=1 Tax=Bimuria novae-zelandiae CBS 107.79 TaxID=1447943 RepID=A0A6A5UQ83_9PLEO|nr:hypothetical protein BU23DRAFT_35842 [Bimuria novae-zelandiae CBS 107.79]
MVVVLICYGIIPSASILSGSMPRLLAGSNVYIYVGYLYDREINAAVFPSSHYCTKEFHWSALAQYRWQFLADVFGNEVQPTNKPAVPSNSKTRSVRTPR